MIPHRNIVDVVKALKEKKIMTLGEAIRIMGYRGESTGDGIRYILGTVMAKGLFYYSQVYGEDATKCVRFYRQIPVRRAPKTPDRIILVWVCNDTKQS